jgi:2-phospho-L-lactate guanylyltransferase (CobY/MobA/RfbA family)
VSDSVEAREHAERLGALALEDADGVRGLAGVVDAALKELELRGATSVLICMSDLPELGAEDVESVARQLEEADVVLVPDLLQQGTNVVALKPPSVLPSCLGHEDSLQRHRDLARDLGLTVSVQLRSGISFDVDHPRDLARLRRH